MHAQSEEKSDSSKDSFYEELEQGSDRFPKYDMKILLRDFNAKVRRGNIFKPTMGNESVLQDSNDSGVRIVKLAASKIWLLRARCSHTETFISTPGPLLLRRRTIRSTTY